MENGVNLNDPRVKRTRQLLLDAFCKLAAEKDIHSIKVQEIAERATVNRATFYAHFRDKEALMDAGFRSLFGTALQEKLSTTSPFTRQSLGALFCVISDFIQTTVYRCPRTPGNYAPLVKAEIQEELYVFILGWLDQTQAQDRKGRFPQETLATVLSWSLFGAAIDYSRNPGDLSREQAVSRVVDLLMEGAGTLISTASVSP